MSKSELRKIAEIAAMLVPIQQVPSAEARGLKYFDLGRKGTKHVGKRTYGHGNKRIYQPA